MGVIKKAWQHKEADSLYVEEVEVGEDTPRQVVSGLVKFIPEAQMQMRQCVLVCNLKPVNMRGVKSHAMVLCATSTDGLKVGCNCGHWCHSTDQQCLEICAHLDEQPHARAVCGVRHQSMVKVGTQCTNEQHGIREKRMQESVLSYE